ncbi:hypothetical protein AK812_SmicGene8375 [Symbiodinium microadriaticum]|uniref:Uncharacterized protein n=1 Tax=Symbiodinium microadriaticum TaxID=2951 RepID=A0A1Q9EL60_SYMMI|nr:hypothetical protein AK812_SmicGene8375 [Symbiodinium microadriaticum]
MLLPVQSELYYQLGMKRGMDSGFTTFEVRVKTFVNTGGVDADGRFLDPEDLTVEANSKWRLRMAAMMDMEVLTTMVMAVLDSGDGDMSDSMSAADLDQQDRLLQKTKKNKIIPPQPEPPSTAAATDAS